MIRARGRLWIALAVYAVLGLAIYAPSLSAYFLADDYFFLDIAASASDVRVVFAPLIGRFVRPWVVLLYYIGYQAAGPTPIVFHLAVLTLHVLNAWLVFLIGRRVLPGDADLAAFLAGLLFLLFSSHSEAVAWVAGAADPIVAFFLLSAFWCFLRARDTDASPGWIGVSIVGVVAAALAKESWVVFPGLVIAYGLCFLGSPSARRRTAAIAVVSAALVAAYLAGRVLVFGSVAGGLAGLGTTMGSGHWLREIAKFVFRCFFPAGPWVLRLWPLAGLFVLATAAMLAIRARGEVIRPLIFTGMATLIALVPVLPLSISIVNTESERFTYLATAFSSMLIVCSAHVILRRRPAAVLACTVFIAWHAVVLAGNARRVHVAGEMARSLAASFAEEVRRRDPDGRAAIFLLNLPDNIGGTYVFRSGFPTAVRLVAPDGAGALPRTDMAATHGLGSQADVVTVRGTGADAFAFDAAPNTLIQRQLADGRRYHISSQTSTGYRVQFRDDGRSTVVLFANPSGRIDYAGTVKALGLPFGAVDMPADGVACSGVSIKLAGWALDDEAVERVRIELLGDAVRVLGDAVRLPGTRPDVAAIFPSLPEHDRAGWEFDLPCAALPPGGGGVRVTAVDRQGHAAVLGERRVTAGR